MPLDRLWAGWRTAYIESTVEAERRPATADPDGGADAAVPVGSLFERILASGEPDEATGILHRGEHCFAILNAYPYGSGHLMVLPNVAAPDLGDLDEATATELWVLVRRAVAAIRAAYAPDGVNVGINLGRAAGAGVPDHLHVHCLPRWSGDTNFTTAIAETRVLPEPLDVSWRKLRQAWPER